MQISEKGENKKMIKKLCKKAGMLLLSALMSMAVLLGLVTMEGNAAADDIYTGYEVVDGTTIYLPYQESNMQRSIYSALYEKKFKLKDENGNYAGTGDFGPGVLRTSYPDSYTDNSIVTVTSVISVNGMGYSGSYYPDWESIDRPGEKATTFTVEFTVIIGNPHVHDYGTNWKSDRDTHWHECSCGEKIDEEAHTWNEGKVKTPPTCQFNGLKQYTCTICGKTKNESIPLLEHNPGEDLKYDGIGHWHPCIVCGGQAGKEPHIKGAGIVTKEPTETETGIKTYYCEVCGYEMQSETIPMHAHDYGTDWKSDRGTHWYECGCGEKKAIEAHTFDEWVIDSPATESTKGSKHRDCIACAYRETIEIPSLTKTPEYQFIEGANSEWMANTNTGVTIRVNGDFEKFTGVKINGNVIDASNYTAKSGSTVITLKSEYLKSLEIGTYNLTVVYIDGEGDTTFTIKGAAKPNDPVMPDPGQTNTVSKDISSPQTGDITNIALLMSLFIVSSGTLVFVYRKRKKPIKS